MGAEMLARKKLGTKDSAVSRPSPLSEETKIAFHSSSFGTTASASEDSVIPVKMLQPSRSTISCALRTASAGLPPVVFDQQLDWTAEEATLGVLHFRPQLATALELLPDRTERTGQ